MKTSILIFFALWVIPLSAQLNLGIMAGANKSIVHYEAVKIGNEEGYLSHLAQLEGMNNNVSYGAFAQYRTGHMFTRTEAMVSRRRTDYYISSMAITRNSDFKAFESVENADINVLGGLTLNRLSLGTGPALHFTTDYKTNLKEFLPYRGSYRDANYGWIVALGLNFNRFQMDVRYEKGFSKIGTDAKYNGRPARFTETADYLSFTVQYIIL